MRVIGLDVHRTMAVAAILEEDRFSSGGRIDLTRDAVIAFGQTLRPDDEVVVDGQERALAELMISAGKRWR